MTTEAVLLLGLFVFILMGAFLGNHGPRAVFGQHAPMLGARIESQLSTGSGFVAQENKILEWNEPRRTAPGKFSQ